MATIKPRRELNSQKLATINKFATPFRRATKFKGFFRPDTCTGFLEVGRKGRKRKKIQGFGPQVCSALPSESLLSERFVQQTWTEVSREKG